jgi:glucosamine 6-phosphate synthetase-like amidotransferase/phosphosugar isomerase protein
MCGIFGWIKSTANIETEIDLVEIFKNGLIESQERGEDATGFYTPGTGIIKDSICADEFVELIPDSIAKERFVLGHVRMASKKYGTDNITNPKNAQPFESDNWVLIHNGSIDTPKLKKYPYTSDVDSEVIVSYAEKTSLKNALASIDGAAAVVLYNKSEKKIYFWTNGERPLVLAYYKGIIFFASTKKIMRKALKFNHIFNIFPDINYATVYEYEPIVFDLKKNRFSRQALIEKKVKPRTSVTILNSQRDILTKDISSVPQKMQEFRSFQSITKQSFNIGCTSNPPSNLPVSQKVIGYCPGNGGNGQVFQK